MHNSKFAQRSNFNRKIWCKFTQGNQQNNGGIKIKILLKAYVKLKRVLQIRNKLTIVAKVWRTSTSTLFESKVRRILVETLHEGNKNGLQREPQKALEHWLRRSDNPTSVNDALKRIYHHQHIKFLSMRISTSEVKSPIKRKILK